MGKMLRVLLFSLICFFPVSCVDKDVETKVDYETPIRNALKKACDYNGKQPLVFDLHQFGEGKNAFQLLCALSLRKSAKPDVEEVTNDKVVRRTKLRIDNYISYDCEVLYEFCDDTLCKINLLIQDRNNEGSVLRDVRRVFDEVYGAGLEYEDSDGMKMYFYFFGNVFARVYIANDFDCVVEYLDAKSDAAKLRAVMGGCFYPFDITYARTMRDFIGSIAL